MRTATVSNATSHGDPALSQAEVIDFLANVDSYDTPVARVDRIETHGALVFLAGNDVFKIKRAVRFPYMDFSTLELRRRACAREIEVNAPHAPGLYLGAVAITPRADGKLSIGGDGEPVEWAVHMRRFADADLLSNLAETSGIGAPLARQIADAVIVYHRAAPISRAPAPYDQMAGTIAEVVEGLGASGCGLPAGLIVEFETGCRRQLDVCRTILQQRAGAGFVRRCHGDLHLANIVMWQGRPTMFDALEFDEALATTDTLYDLAFLLMDLDRRGNRLAANVVLNRYLWHSQQILDLDGLAALPLFLGLRAGIRAMVLAQRAAQVAEAPGAAARKSARGYLAAAVGYLSPPKPLLIAVGGLSGTGKSTMAAALAPMIGPTPGAIHLRSDLERKTLFGVEETERLSAECYSREANERVYALLGSKAQSALAAGHAVITDAAFLRAEERQEIESVARSLSLPFHGLWLTAPPDTLLARVAARSGDASDATVDIVRQQLALGAESGNWARIDAGGSPGQALDAARELLRTCTTAGATR